MNCHQTAQCPSCNKDSWQSTWEATFTPVECLWCKCKFVYKPGTGRSVIVGGKKNKK